MNLLIVTQALDRDDENLGAFYYWFEELAKKADRMTILALRKGAHAFPPHVRVESFGEGRSFVPKLWKYWELFSHFFAQADAVLFHQSPEFVLAAAPFLLGTMQKKTSVLWYAHKSVNWRLALAERLIDWVASSSPDGFRLPSKKVVFIGQAINTDLFLPSPNAQLSTPNSTLRLLTIGRIAPVKDYETIIRACSFLTKETDRDWTLSIVGGPILPRDVRYLDRLQALVRGAGLENRVRFFGARPYSDIPKLLPEHDIFINASRTGSLDKAVLEAMACGVSVITANEAYRALVSDKYFLEHTSPEFLAKRILAIAGEERPNRILREIVLKNHSLAKTIEKIHTLLSAAA